MAARAGNTEGTMRSPVRARGWSNLCPVASRVVKNLGAGCREWCRQLRLVADARHGARSEGDRRLKYMIMMFGGLGASLTDRDPEWIAGMQATMMRLDRELRESGEVVESRHLTDP